jgi:ankyrin repeat protein
LALCSVAVPAGLWAAGRDLRVVDAAKRQDAAEVRALIASRADVNAATADGSTALHWTSYWDDRATSEALIRAGAKVNAVTDLGVTPLALACANGSDRVVTALLKAKADPNLAQPTGETPLMTCARSGSVVAVKALVAEGAKLDAVEEGRGQTALMWAVAARHPQVVQALVEAGADVNARTKVTTQWIYTGFRYITAPPPNPTGIVVEVKEGGFTPVLFAAQQGDRESMRILLAGGARIADADAEGTSPLVLAAHSGHGEVARMLLDAGADPNDGKAGYTALHAAVLRGDAQLVDALLVKGARVDAVLTKGTAVRKYSEDFAFSSAWVGATPYWLASRFAEPAIMRTLATAGADTRLASADGTTPLMTALMTPLGQGDRRDRFQTEAEIAQKPAGEDAAVALRTVRLALELGADVNGVTETGDTAMHLAAARSLPEVIELLATKGADVNTKNKKGMTPLAVASIARRPFGDVAPPGTPEPAQSPTAVLLRKLGAQD